MPKRKDYITWDSYFIAIASLAAYRSKDPHTQVGACIVDNENHIISVGYNGLPKGCDDDLFPWDGSDAEREFIDTKYPYVCHAEANAILNANRADLHNTRIYVSLFPCNECAKLIIQAGIDEVIYANDKYHDEETTTASRRMFDAAKVSYREYEYTGKRIIINA